MGHFYGRDGTPHHFVTAKNGSSRASTIADAKKHGWVPSVTEILSILNKPALTNWKVDQAILSALTLPIVEGESEADYLARIKRDSEQQAKEAAEEGSRIHAAIDASFKGLPFDSRYIPHVEGVRAKLAELYPGISDWVTERTFASPLGYGGCCDIHSPSTGIVGDHKGKDLAPGDTRRLAYDQDRQIAAYNRGLGLPENEGFNLFVSRTHPGHVVAHVWTKEQLADAWEVFRAALALWKAVKKFDPSF